VTSAQQAADASLPIEFDPTHAKALAFIQQGQWAEAAEALAQLAQRYPGSEELCGLQQRLALHLSAEETWSAKKASRLPPALRPLGVRVLLLANLAVYLLLAIGWLVGQGLGLFHE